MTVWYFIVHILGIDYGLPYGHWGWYDFWSGVAGSFLVGMCVFAGTRWAHGTCHRAWWCWRRGSHPAAGGLFGLCWKHHPDLGVRPHGALIRKMHEEWKARSRGPR